MADSCHSTRRAFLKSAPHYRETTHAMSLTKTRQMVLNTAWNELQAWRRKYADLQEFASMIRVIDALAIEMKESTD